MAGIFVPWAMEVMLEKDLSYLRYTLNDVYPYDKTQRRFQFDKIVAALATTDSLRAMQQTWAVLQNKKNSNGYPPVAKDATMSKNNVTTDKYGIEIDQAIPLYTKQDQTRPARYNYDGALVQVHRKTGNFSECSTTNFKGNYLIPTKYLKIIDDSLLFSKVIIVDRHYQNISTFERIGCSWMIRSMNPATTGADKTVYQRPTPLGLFVLQQKVYRMYYYKDGTKDIDGYAPYANRFCQGAYIHGVPVNLPETEMIEYSPTLGTYPRSHMCVRNATSHAKFIYDHFPAYQSLIFVIE
ncbi:MAG: L,D-transpeptidase [Dysgonamonadaceae bacterium]|nr:L,D-transpeptidase [Dysgonamonadaceae bacterium]